MAAIVRAVQELGVVHEPVLPPGVAVWERGWLSSNNVLLAGPEGAFVVDTGYASHSPQTLALVQAALGGAPLLGIVNTHLHSDHCGGNAALQGAYPGVQTWIPPGQADDVLAWDEAALSYAATGQFCPRFAFTGLLQPGQVLPMAGLAWQVHAAPGHDPHAVVLFEPNHGVLLSGDALWENGFGVVFPELAGEPGFAEVAATLDLIESLAPRWVVPGHGRVFGDVPAALGRARARLAQFVDQPERHLRHALKVLLKFKLLELQRVAWHDYCRWAAGTAYLQQLHHAHGGGVPFALWLTPLVDGLVAAGAARREGDWLINL